MRTALLLLMMYFPLYLFSQSTEYQIDSVVSLLVKKEKFEGTVLVAANGKVVYEKGWGWANREWQQPNAASTKFEIASISKQFTAALILLLVEQNLLNLEGKISDYLPYYRKDTGSKITLHHLLTHRSGIPNYTSLPGVWSDSLRTPYATRQLVQKFCSGDLLFEPGSQYQYNNSGYFLLAAIAERVTGKSFATLTNELLINRFGLKEIGVADRETVLPQRAQGYAHTMGKIGHAAYMHIANLNGAGSLYATARALLQWDSLLHTGAILSETSYKKMISAYSEGSSWIAPYPNQYGYGLGLAQLPHPNGGTEPAYFHSGHVAGFSGFYVHFTSSQHTVIILSNIANISTPAMCETAIHLHLLLGQELGR